MVAILTVLLVLLCLTLWGVLVYVWHAHAKGQHPELPHPAAPTPIPAGPPTVRVRFVSQTGALLKQVDLNPSQRRPQLVYRYSSRQTPGVFLAEQRLPSGVWIYRYQHDV